MFQRPKSDANKQDFETKLSLTCQAQTTPKTIGILTKVERVVSNRADKFGDGRTDAGNYNTRRPILASGKNKMTVPRSYLDRMSMASTNGRRYVDNV